MLEPSVVVLFTFVVAPDFYRRFQTSSFPLPFTKENRFWIERLRGFKSESVWGKIRPRDVETSSSLEKLRIQDESISNIPRDLSSLSKLFRNSSDSCHDLGRGNSANLPTIPQPRSSASTGCQRSLPLTIYIVDESVTKVDSQGGWKRGEKRIKRSSPTFLPASENERIEKSIVSI